MLQEPGGPRLDAKTCSVPEADWTDLMALTVTFVRGVSPDAVVRRLGADPSAGVEMLHHEVWEAQGSGAEFQLGVQVDQVDGWTVVVEPNGWLLTAQGTAESVSAGGELVSVFWNVNALTQFIVARDTVVVRRFDPLLYDQPSIGEPLPEEAGLPFGQPGESRAAAVELAEQLTGVRLTKGWLLNQPHPSWTGFPIP